jgi:hypothetical protein
MGDNILFEITRLFIQMTGKQLMDEFSPIRIPLTPNGPLAINRLCDLGPVVQSRINAN